MYLKGQGLQRIYEKYGKMLTVDEVYFYVHFVYFVTLKETRTQMSFAHGRRDMQQFEQDKTGFCFVLFCVVLV